jgi:RNA polymerase sigma-70 factor (ECF subfamily)
MQTTSISLLERIASSGDNDDWQKLLLIYRPFILNVVSGYPALMSQADDITQDVMLVLMRELPVFQRQRTGSFRSWLRQIAVNQLRTAARKSKKFNSGSSNEEGVADLVEQLADPQSIASQKWDEEYERVVFKRLVELVRPTVADKMWQAFERYALQDQPAAKVAEELGISLNSVLLAKSRILKQLRTEAKGLLDE